MPVAPSVFSPVSAAIAASTGDGYRQHPGGPPRPVRRPRRPVATEDIGAVAATLSENNRARRRRIADALLDKKARAYVPGEDCSHCGAALEMNEEGRCNTCHKPYHTGSLGKRADDFSAVMGLFREARDKPLDIARKPDGNLWVNAGDWTEVSHKDIHKVAPGAEYVDELAGTIPERHGWERLYPKKAAHISGNVEKAAITMPNLGPIGRGLKSFGSGIGSLFRGAESPAARQGWTTASGAVSPAVPKYGPGLLQQGWNAAASKVAPVAKAVSPWAQTVGGGALGYQTAGDVAGVGDQPVSPWARVGGVAAGMSVGNPQLRARMLQSGVGRRYVNSMTGAMGGGFAGSSIDQAAGYLGSDTNNQFGQWGSRAGLVGGLASPRVGTAANNVGWAAASGSNPAFAVPEIADVARAAAGRGQYAGQNIGQRLFGPGVRGRRVGQGLAAATLGAGGVAYGAGAIRDKALESAGVDPQAFNASRELGEVARGLETGDPSAIAKARQLNPQIGLTPDGKFDVNLARQQIGQARTNAQTAVMERLGVNDYVRGVQAQVGDQVEARVRQTADSIIQEKFGGAAGLLQGGSGFLGNIVSLADGVLGTIGLPVGQMTGVQKMLTLLGALGLIGGFAGGGTTMGLLGGAALAYGVGGGLGLFGGNGQQPGQQAPQPQAQPGASNRQQFTPPAPQPAMQPAAQPAAPQQQPGMY